MLSQKERINFLNGGLLLSSSLSRTRISSVVVQRLSLGDQLSHQLASSILQLGEPAS